MNIAKPPLRVRAFTSILISATFLALIISGVVLFISPPGRIANWTDWRILGLTKHDWGDLHISFSSVFLLAAGFHLVFNFRPFLNYFKTRLKGRLGFRWEWIAALALCGLVFAGTRADVPPISTLLDLNERAKRSWEDARTAAPIPHAELLNLEELAAEMGVPLETALERLAAKGVEDGSAEVVVATLAARNNRSAQQIHEIVQGENAIMRGGCGGGGGGKGKASGNQGNASGEVGNGPGVEMEEPRPGGGGGGGTAGWGGGGLGRMTFREFCESRKIDPQDAQTRLEAKGVKFSPERSLREIAAENGYERPHEIAEIIEGAKE